MISDHFALAEFACRDGRVYPEAWIEDRLRPLCQVLETIRAAIDRPVVIVSGYRSPEHNKAVGGATHSQHMEGRAADIRVAELSAGMLHAKVVELYSQGAIKIGGLGRYKSWVHVDIRAGQRLASWDGPGIA